MEQIKLAAIKSSDGVVFTGRDHAVIFQTRVFDGVSELRGCEQGFITDTNRFVGRTEAAEIAIAAGQIKNKSCTQLFSEDITGNWPWAKEQIAELQAENKRLERALQRYGHHDSPCLALEDDECICGFKQALQEKPK